MAGEDSQCVVVGRSGGLSTVGIGATNEVLICIFLRQLHKNLYPPQFIHPDDPDLYVPLDQHFHDLLGCLKFVYQYTLDSSLNFLSNLRFEFFMGTTLSYSHCKSRKIDEFKLGQTTQDVAGNCYFKLNPRIKSVIQEFSLKDFDFSLNSSLTFPLSRRLYRHISHMNAVNLEHLGHIPTDLRFRHKDLAKDLGIRTGSYSQICEKDPMRIAIKLGYPQLSNIRQLLRIAENELSGINYILPPEYIYRRSTESTTYILS